MRRLLFNEKGVVLPLIVILIFVVTLLGFTSIFMVNTQTKMISQSESSETALHKAEKGIHKYIWRLNDDSEFYKNYNGENDIYEVEDNVEIEEKGENEVIIRSTGEDPDDPSVKRTIEAVVKSRTFTEHGLVNNTEMNEHHDIIYWIDDEKFYGPFHTNDTLYIEGDPTFYGRVTVPSAGNGEPDIDGADEDDDNIFPKDGYADTAEVLAWPPNIDDLKFFGELYNGHYYEGTTYINLDGNHGYDVKYWDDDKEKYKKEEGKDLPDNGVIYVDGRYGTSDNLDSRQLITRR